MAEHRIVAPKVTGSTPVGHPSFLHVSVATTKANNPLLKSLQREAADLVRASGWSAADFTFMELQADQIITSLMYRPDPGYRFAFYPGQPWAVRFFPGRRQALKRKFGLPNWAAVLSRVGWWLRYLKREVDPWAAVAASVESFQFGGGRNQIDNSAFTPAEQPEVIERIEQLRVRLLDSERLSEQDRHTLIARLDYLTDAVGRLGRFE